MLAAAVHGRGALSPQAGRLDGDFTARGSGSASEPGFSVTYTGTAGGTLQGPLAKARVAGTFTGHYVAREDGRVERGTEHGSFKGIADLTNDLIRVRVKAEETVVTGKGEYSLIVTTAG